MVGNAFPLQHFEAPNLLQPLALSPLMFVRHLFRQSTLGRGREAEGKRWHFGAAHILLVCFSVRSECRVWIRQFRQLTVFSKACKISVSHMQEFVQPGDIDLEWKSTQQFYVFRLSL